MRRLDHIRGPSSSLQSFKRAIKNGTNLKAAASHHLQNPEVVSHEAKPKQFKRNINVYKTVKTNPKVTVFQSKVFHCGTAVVKKTKLM